MPEYDWVWRAKSFERVERPGVKASSAGASWSVLMGERDFAWGYCIELPDDARAHLMWHTRIDVLAAGDGMSPGLAFHDSEEGVLFQVNAALGVAELRRLRVNNRTERIELFSIARIECPYAISLTYNALTGECAGMVGDDRIFDRTLPWGSIPALPAVTSVEIVTTVSTDPGSAEYGNLTLKCE
ncbi:MAG: hypothetical protein LBS93_07900 [Synergistaceae bacterium]|jgi:hypothetical protein|nr:hypothetical protein [Synergistaceae bacterium]